ncbi:MAG TPA: universal stress protein, partial [Syntrophales bacterium]|nr:universal stress protein [Syntrophales bacterium]
NNSATIILPGPAEKALHRFMQDRSVELLIMGTVGKHCPPTGLMESTAASMLKVATYPLLMVS